MSTRDKKRALVSRFAVVGLGNTFMDIALFMALQTFLPIFYSNFIASLATMAVAYTLHSRFTFRHQELSFKKFLLFVSTTGVVLWLLQPFLILNFAHLLKSFTSPAFTILIAKLLAIGICLCCNFCLYRWVIFRSSSTADLTSSTKEKYDY